jgi:PPOX class probable F420-dependent enzyme
VNNRSPASDTEGALAALHDAKFLSLTTFRRNGDAVATPVEFATADGAIYVRTASHSGKVKRIRNDPHVRFARCTMRGAVRGPAFDGVAALLGAAESEALAELLGAKYGVLWRVAVRLRRPKTQGIRIVPAAGAGKRRG